MLEDGRVRERGSHHTLLKDHSSLYSYLWQKQHEMQLPLEELKEEVAVNESKAKYDFPVPEAIT